MKLPILLFTACSIVARTAAAHTGSMDVFPYGAAAGAPAFAWKYYQTDAVTPPAGWTTAADAALPAAWQSTAGSAPYRYGSFSLWPGGTGTMLTTSRRAYYFRRTFDLPLPASSLTKLRLSMRRDDGIVVHINGVRIGASNMPAVPSGGYTYTSYAVSPISGSAESAEIIMDYPSSGTGLAGLNLQPTGNVIAVELHNMPANATTSQNDIGFDLRVQADYSFSSINSLVQLVPNVPAWVAGGPGDVRNPAIPSLKLPPITYRESVTLDRPINLEGQPGSEIRGSDVWPSTGWQALSGGWVSPVGFALPPALYQQQRAYWIEGHAQVTTVNNNGVIEYPMVADPWQLLEQTFLNGTELAQTPGCYLPFTVKIENNKLMVAQRSWKGSSLPAAYNQPQLGDEVVAVDGITALAPGTPYVAPVLNGEVKGLFTTRYDQYKTFSVTLKRNGSTFISQVLPVHHALPIAGQFAVYKDATGGKRIMLGSSPASSSVFEVSTRTSWISPSLRLDAVSLKGLRFRHAANAVWNPGISTGSGDGWIISDIEASDVHAGLVTLSTSTQASRTGTHVIKGNTLTRSKLHDAGHICLDGTGGRYDVTDNDIYRGNHSNWFNIEWGAGGVKFTGINAECLAVTVNGSNVAVPVISNSFTWNGQTITPARAVFARNRIHDCDGPGLWMDEGCIHVDMDRNYCYRNSYPGLFYEVSFAGEIRNNICWANGWRKLDANTPWCAGILISTSGYCNVHDNLNAWNYHGIGAVDQSWRQNLMPGTANGSTTNAYNTGNHYNANTTLETWGRPVSSLPGEGLGTAVAVPVRDGLGRLAVTSPMGVPVHGGWGSNIPHDLTPNRYWAYPAKRNPGVFTDLDGAGVQSALSSARAQAAGLFAMAGAPESEQMPRFHGDHGASDFDDDGIDNATEVQLGQNPFAPEDANGNGLPDVQDTILASALPVGGRTLWLNGDDLAPGVNAEWSNRSGAAYPTSGSPVRTTLGGSPALNLNSAGNWNSGAITTPNVYGSSGDDLLTPQVNGFTILGACQPTGLGSLSVTGSYQATGYRFRAFAGSSIGWSFWSGEHLPSAEGYKGIVFNSLHALNAGPSVFGLHFLGNYTQSRLRVDGLTEATDAGEIRNANSHLGFGNGVWGEVLAYDRALTAVEYQIAEAYLRAKFKSSGPAWDGAPTATPGDHDSDGLASWKEIEIGTNASLADTDSDGLSDGDEIALATEPLIADSDGDGLTDGDEVNVHGLDPLSFDSDGDILSDGEEIALGTSGWDPDTDADGVMDGEEVQTYSSNPLVADTDGDGINDGEEVADGSNLTTAEPLISSPLASGTSRTLWLKGDDLTPGQSLSTWSDRSGQAHHLTLANNPQAVAGLMNGHHALRLEGSGYGYRSAAPVDLITPEQDGCTILWAVRHLDTLPSQPLPQTAIMAQEVYAYQYNGSAWVSNPNANGFRAGLLWGRPAMWTNESLPFDIPSSQSLALWNSSAQPVQAARNYVVAFHYGGPSGVSQLYVDGALQSAESNKLMRNPTNTLSIAGANWGEILIYDRKLNNRERKTADAYLRAKFQNAGPAWDAVPGATPGDADEDGLPTWREMELGYNPLLPDSNGNNVEDYMEDWDADGMSNLMEDASGTRMDQNNSGGYLGPEFVIVSSGGQNFGALRFRALPGVAHGFTYQVQQKVDAGPWADLNHYSQMHGAPVPVGDASGAEWITVRGTLPVSSSSTVQLRLTVEH
jgi:Bacterial TSP3 repeat